MGSIFGPFIDIEEKPTAWQYAEDINSYILDNIAKDVEARLRPRLDSSGNLFSRSKTGPVKVRNESGRLVIQAEGAEEGQENTTLDDLFRSSAQSPYIENNKLIFRELKEQEVSRSNLEAVKNSIEEVLRVSVAEHLEEGIKRVRAENPDLLR